MLSDFLELFVRLEPHRTQDAAGGSAESWTDGDTFMAGVTDQPGSVISPGGLHQLRTHTMLLHEESVMLRLHDRVRRVRDGMEFTVQGDSGDQRMPRTAAVRYACVPVEKAVTAQ